MFQNTKNHIAGSWIVMYTRCNCEKKASDFLYNKNIEHFLPVREKLSKWHDRYKLINKPIFPSYIFVRLRSAQEYFLSLSNSYSRYYLKSGGRIAVLDSDIIESIRIATIKDSEYDIVKSLSRGEKVFITGGAFNGLKGELVEFKGKSKVQIAIGLINSAILITMNPEHICKITHDYMSIK